MIQTFSALKKIVSTKNIVRIKFYSIFCIVASILEVATLLTIGPVIESLVSSSSRPINTDITSTLDSSNDVYIIFLVLIISVTLSRITILYFQTRLAFNFGAEVQQSVVSKVLSEPWLYEHLSSSDLISLSAVKSERVIRETALQFLMIINSSFTILAVILGLLIANVKITTIAVLSIGLTYASIMWGFKLWISIASKKIAKLQDLNILRLEDIYKTKFEINLYKKVRTFYANLNHIVKDYRRTQSFVHMLTAAPRFLIEGIALSGFILLVLLTDGINGNTELIGFIGVLALSAQRLMPMVQVIYAGRTAISGNSYAVQEFIDILQTKKCDDLIELQDKFYSIEFIDLNITGCDYVKLSPINFYAKAGDLVIIKGESGIGKSTFFKLIMGGSDLSASGIIKINNQIVDLESISIRKQIAYVPQNVSLLRQSLNDNISLSLDQEKIDKSSLLNAIKTVDLLPLIEMDSF